MPAQNRSGAARGRPVPLIRSIGRKRGWIAVVVARPPSPEPRDAAPDLTPGEVGCRLSLGAGRIRRPLDDSRACARLTSIPSKPNIRTPMRTRLDGPCSIRSSAAQSSDASTTAVAGTCHARPRQRPSPGSSSTTRNIDAAIALPWLAQRGRSPIRVSTGIISM